MEYKCAFCGHTSQTRCGHHELQAEVGTLIEGNRLLNLQIEEARKIIEQVSCSPEFKEHFHDGSWQDQCGVHAFMAKYAEKQNHETQGEV